MSVIFERSFTVDLLKPMKQKTLPDALYTGDSGSHLFRVRLLRDAEPVTGVLTVSAYCLRPDGVTVLLPGQVSGGELLVTLNEACYRVPGWCRLCVRACEQPGGIMTTVLSVNLLMNAGSSDAVADPDQQLPSLDGLLRELTHMQQTARLADEATARANAAAERIPSVSLNAAGDVVISH